ncbi:hypothetical protein [Sinorhizobium psoraleae]|uniref:Uncharacterized protein n=1 Tax=Sinorhizobium psoraleae TaxID=520838 RepID=A0ABT4KQR8_9HYPH|nr:hypothetical protein [Sinorhizobium psoraleae]MCZ4093631.1 hypothetical protein [Sinorhizobium psoraleae]
MIVVQTSGRGIAEGFESFVYLAGKTSASIGKDIAMFVVMPPSCMEELLLDRTVGLLPLAKQLPRQTGKPFPNSWVG